MDERPLSPEEQAKFDALGVPVGTIMSRLSRARDRVRLPVADSGATSSTLALATPSAAFATTAAASSALA